MRRGYLLIGHDEAIEQSSHGDRTEVDASRWDWQVTDGMLFEGAKKDLVELGKFSGGNNFLEGVVSRMGNGVRGLV